MDSLSTDSLSTDSLLQAAARLSLVDPADAPQPVADAFNLLPPINVFRAMANAETLYPTYIRYVSLLFQHLELDSALERMIVLHVAKQSDCFYAWRQNVVVAKSVGVSQEQIDALEIGDVLAWCFTEQQKTAFKFTNEVMELIEVTDATYAEAKRYLSDRALTEMLYVIGTYMFIVRVIRTGHVPLDDKPADAPAVDP